MPARVCVRSLIALASLISTLAVAPVTGAASTSNATFIEIADGAWVLSEPDPIAPFRLKRHDGELFDNDAFTGKWSFVFFGYTHCPDICPTTLVVFKGLREALVARGGHAYDLQYVFVSVDPQRDTPQRLREYVTHFDPGLIGVTGDDAELARLSTSVGVVYARDPTGSGGGDYLVDHSSAVLLVNPYGRLHAVFAAPHTPGAMLEAFERIRARADAATGAGAVSATQ